MLEKKKVGRPRGSQDLANYIRASAKRAMEESERKGKPLCDLLMTEMEARPLEFIKAISAYTPKEIDLVDEREVSELSEAELDDRIRRIASRLEARLGGTGAVESGAEATEGSPRAPSELH